MAKETHELLIVGLAEAGKTSFIHAVDDLLQNPPTADALRATGLAHDRTCLERDKATYRAGHPLERTKRMFQGGPPELWFEDPASGRQGRMFLPDVSGEVYRDQWVDRVWEKSYAESLKTVRGMLLFVRADLPASNAELLGNLIEIAKKQGPRQEWDPKKASAQVQLVDVLQFITTRGDIPRPLRVGVVMSAWDTVEKMGALAPSPTRLFERDWALLAQYLETNADTFVAKVYGASALGGTQEELKELRKIPPTERVKIVDGANVSKDLTRPLRWLLQLD